MHTRSVDEETLAAFLAGTLSAPRRAAVLAELNDDADARELLAMAHQALDAARSPRHRRTGLTVRSAA